MFKTDKLVLIDEFNPKAHFIPIIGVNEIPLGRGFLNVCNDKRISRNHGVIKVIKDDEIIIRSTHVNPIYYRTEKERIVRTLHKFSEIKLICQDAFGLLPDACWFRISKQLNFSSSESLYSDDSGDLTWDQLVERGYITIIDPSKETAKRKTTTPDPNAEEAKRIKTEPVDEDEGKDAEHDKTIETHQEQLNSCGENAVKSEPSDDVDEVPENNNEFGEPSNTATVKNEKIQVKFNWPGYDSEEIEQERINAETTAAQAHLSTDDYSSTDNDQERRDCCPFGIRCYRTSNGHRAKMAHPGDEDYRLPRYARAIPAAPECPYGKRCYRRNPIHFDQYSHPPQTDPGKNRARRMVYHDRAGGESADDEAFNEGEDPFEADGSTDDEEYRPPTPKLKPTSRKKDKDE